MTGEEPRTPLLSMTDVHKRYGGVHALRGASLTITDKGTVHGLLGQNGSGKSTLLGVLSGQIRPDGGSIRIDGRAVSLSSPVAALAHGIAMVSQENATAGNLSIAENILMGRRLAGSPWKISWRATERRARAALEALGLDYDPNCLVSELRPDQRQMVEIARAMSMNARVIVLDEPTSSLSEDEVEHLFTALRRLTAQGVSTIFVSHRLSEFLTIVDELTVLRDGRTVATGPAAEFEPASLVRAMVGDGGGARTPATGGALGQVLSAEYGRSLRIRSLTSGRRLSGVSLTARSGEIVGLAGLSGCGRSELLECVFGVRRSDGGSVEIDGRARTFRTSRTAIRAGLAFLPPDRKTEGLVLGMSLESNLRMVATHRRSRLTNPRRQSADRRLAEQLIGQLAIRTPASTAAVQELSGGNQQKVALGKWLAAGSQILLLDEPTRGVDAAARIEIHRLLRELATEGCLVLVSSSENDELLEICDRVVVLFQGRVTATVDAAHADEALIAHHAGGFE